MARAIIKNIKNDGSGGSMNCITITANDKPIRDLTFSLPYAAQVLNMNVGDLVRYESVTPAGKPEVVLYAERLATGVIASLAGDNVSGVITENISGKQINFLQPNQDLIGLKVGTAVKYELVSASYVSSANTSGGALGTGTSSGTGGTVGAPPAPAGTSDDLAIEVRLDPNL